MPYAPNHHVLHTKEYYLNVTLRLHEIKDDDASEGRLVLRSIKRELITGTFPF
jgi:hypothetical protein